SAFVWPLPAAPRPPARPALLFAKTSRAGEQGRRFYACSACRDRRDCSFFQWEDEKVSETRLAACEEYNRNHQPSFTHRLKNFVVLPLSQRKFCQDCQQLLLPAEWQDHIDLIFVWVCLFGWLSLGN
uniref:GRF-type domain-containing protein n=1 Tax=Nothoprocta perdicaria TaxID=30464 RepID=A0A8C6YMW1_NOTPE